MIDENGMRRFNSKMVQLKENGAVGETGESTVSIPKWYN